MKWIASLLGTLLGVGVLVFAARLLHLDELVRRSVETGHLPDVVMGVLCFVWLLVVLKAPWDLFFQTYKVLWEHQQSRERHIALTPGREAYLIATRRRLAFFAVGAHLVSAGLVALAAYLNGGVVVGYWFAAFFVISTLFRPLLAGYGYLSHKLSAMGEEARYPRLDVEELRVRLTVQEEAAKQAQESMEQMRQDAENQNKAHAAELRDVRQKLHAIGREFETTVSRLTDNRDVISGIQAFVRLVSQAATPPSPVSAEPSLPPP